MVILWQSAPNCYFTSLINLISTRAYVISFVASPFVIYVLTYMHLCSCKSFAKIVPIHPKKLHFTHFYRTVLTHVEKSLYCYLFFHLCTAYPLFLTRRYAGPFPEVLCWWMKLLVNFVPNCLFFSFCVNIILRVSIKAKFKLELQNSNPN